MPLARKLWLLACLLCWHPATGQQSAGATVVLYNQVFDTAGQYPELVWPDARYTANGIQMRVKGQLARLNKYYSLATRLVRYRVRFSADARAVFQSDQGDFKAFVDMTRKTISIQTNPVTRKTVPFLDPGHDYLVEVHRNYQTVMLRLTDLYTGAADSIAATTDGTGGVRAGAVGPGFFAGLQHDYYCFGLAEGSEICVQQMTVLSNECDLLLLIYGDSITEPEGYFPRADFAHSWTQLIRGQAHGKVMASGRGGTTINELLDRIKNELPFIKAKYVMVTIGTNGGNTEQNLSALVEYIKLQGAIPILNNIPANESGSQVPVNALIEKVRQRYRIKGARFDKATSVGFDGAVVDKTTMWHEDYDFGQIYHHPNAKGSRLMFLQTLTDIPEIYE
ncbi:SGNH/GDSL hydrolase family protein [Niabella drilacis]|uniref:Lysophospholipase L1 n=1 Tax=Niabella drilacis (strain DSM 25811 / CCM 8410 / CCUG 62505 / LMG 26954 / E90) TaxID=1285928 RepID=A0A1G6Y163_NIADE|nr:SGNH/GDSL hydrolase family protein [Niabella drilacis]SDD83365.1 Lysophospholipase L1 [Niabella drilacis]